MNNILSTWFKRYFTHHESGALLLILLVTVFLIKVLGQILTPIIISVVLAYLLYGLVRKLEIWELPHLMAVLTVFFLFIGGALLIFLWLLPLLWEEGVGLMTEVPNIVNFCQKVLLKLHGIFPELVTASQLQQLTVILSNHLTGLSKEILTLSVASLFSVVTAIIYLVLVPILVFFLLRDGTIIINWLTRFLPHDRQVLRSMWQELRCKIRSYVKGKAIEVIIMSVIMVVIFNILQLRYANLLGVLVGLSVLVPYVGYVVVTVPLVIIGLIQWGFTEHFFYCMGVYVIASLLDANILVPFLFAEVMKLHPLAIVLGVLIFGSLFGFWGVFFAIPLVTLVNVVIKYWRKLNHLQDV